MPANGYSINLLRVKGGFKLLWSEIKLRARVYFGLTKVMYTLKSGLKMELDSSDYTEREFFKDERFEAQAKKLFMSYVKKGMTVLDIGAFSGYYTLDLAKKVGEGVR